jgi:hypothetical protein
MYKPTAGQVRVRSPYFDCMYAYTANDCVASPLRTYRAYYMIAANEWLAFLALSSLNTSVLIHFFALSSDIDARKKADSHSSPPPCKSRIGDFQHWRPHFQRLGYWWREMLFNGLISRYYFHVSASMQKPRVYSVVQRMQAVPSAIAASPSAATRDAAKPRTTQSFLALCCASDHVFRCLLYDIV